MNWKQLSFQVKKQQADLVSEVLIGLGSISITYKDAYDDAIYEPPLGQVPLWDDIEINALFYTSVDYLMDEHHHNCPKGVILCLKKKVSSEGGILYWTGINKL